MKYISKYMGYKVLLAFILCAFCIYDAEAQLSRNQIVGSYIYNFGNNLQWQDNSFSEFTITLLTTDTGLIEELNRMTKKEKIQNKRIRLYVNSQPDESILESQLVFISNELLSYYLPVFDMVEGREILLVSENYDNKSYVMLNLYDAANNKLLFEINKPNILNQNLILSDQILLMGGTEIDIAAIYLKSQHSLRDMELRTQEMKQNLETLNFQINESNAIMKGQADEMKMQKYLIDRQVQEIDSQRLVSQRFIHRINTYKASIDIIQHQLVEERVQLNKLEGNLRNNEALLQKQQNEILLSRDVLEVQQSKMDSIDNEIIKSQAVLKKQKKIIVRQKSSLISLTILVLVFFILIGLLLYSYRQINKKSSVLAAQKKEIDRINEELQENNEELSVSLENVKKMQQQLVQSEKMASLGVLSAGIAHEINNPINFVYAGINSLRQDFEDIDCVLAEINNINPDAENIKEQLAKLEEVKKENYFNEAYQAIPEIINDIKIGADRTAKIVKGLRSFSRSDKGEKQHVNVHDELDTALLLLRNKYKKHIEIIKQYADEMPEIECFAGQVNQVFLNIISNAIDSIYEKGTIWISTFLEKDSVKIIVKDSGCGMDELTMGKIFDPFFTTKKVGEGTGLGLSISYGIVKDHKGELKVTSELNKGSEFTVTLPFC
jgi:signal transduction histidine kinase